MAIEKVESGCCRSGCDSLGNGCCERARVPGSFGIEWRGHPLQLFKMQGGESFGERAGCSKVKGCCSTVGKCDMGIGCGNAECQFSAFGAESDDLRLGLS